MKTWVVNDAHVDTDELGQRQLVVGVTTQEWIAQSGDEARPGDATTFMWVVLSVASGHLLEIGFRPHDHVTEDECVDVVRSLLWIVRLFEGDEPHVMLGRTLPVKPPL